MTVPGQSQLHRPLLKIASDAHEPMSKWKFLDSITGLLELTPDDLAERVPSGEQRIAKNIGFALYYLTSAGLLKKPIRAHWEITGAGRKCLETSTGEITIAELNRLATQHDSGHGGHSDGAPNYEDATPASIPHGLQSHSVPKDDDASPQDKIDFGFRELRKQLLNDLRESISQMPPDRFEKLVVDLLQKMGYGKGQVVGKSGDRGIDGIINQDALGLEKVYLQAKRWQNQVGEPEIRNFIGSLVVAEGASKGVFVTNSTFSASARQTAQTTSNMLIRLIDGPE